MFKMGDKVFFSLMGGNIFFLACDFFCVGDHLLLFDLDLVFRCLI